MKRIVLALLLICACISEAQTSNTRNQLEQDISTYEQLQQQRQQELENIRQSLGDLEASINARLSERDRISQDLTDLRSERQSILNNISSLEAEQAKTEADIKELEAQLESLKVRIQAMLENLYKQRSNGFATSVAKAQTFHELQVKNYYLSLLADQDVALVNELDVTVSALFSAQQQLIAQVQDLTAAEQELARNEASLEAKQQELNGIIAELESSREGQLAQRASVLLEQEKLEAELDRSRVALANEIARLEREAQEARRRAQEAVEARERQRLTEQAQQSEARIQALTLPAEPEESEFIYPVDSPQLLNRYGDLGPYITLRAPLQGAAVRAIHSGVVGEVSWLGANSGYVVSINHSSSLTTAYWNLQLPEVQPNQRIEQGEIIGYLGGGGLLPADVLRFTVRVVDGNQKAAYVDPADYLGF